MLTRIFAFCILIWATGCSVPNLETAQCIAARDAVKRLYSLHMSEDIRPTQVSLEARRQFITSALYNRLNGADGEVDYFTATDNYPRAFRVGECQSSGENSATLGVLLLWRDDVSTDQKKISVDVVRPAEAWLINEVR
ncbi:MAG: hypothetical protein WKF34_02635 [Pyrinomonadaceae bacterium]